MNSFVLYLLSIIGVLYLGFLIFLCFKIMDLFLKINAIEEGKEFSGFYKELNYVRFENIIYLFPLFYRSSQLGSESIALFSKKRERYIVLFWWVFSLGILALIIYRLFIM